MPAYSSSCRFTGGVAAQIGEDAVVPEHDLIGAQRHLAGRLHHLAGGDMECAKVYAALDHVALDHAVGQARRRMGAFVVGDVKRAVDVIDRKPVGADLERLDGARRNIGLSADADHTIPTFRHQRALLRDSRCRINAAGI